METTPEPISPPQYLDFEPIYLEVIKPLTNSSAHEASSSDTSIHQGNSATPNTITIVFDQFDQLEITVPRQQDRVEQEHPTDKRLQTDGGDDPSQIAQPSRANTTDSNNHRPEQIYNQPDRSDPLLTGRTAALSHGMVGGSFGVFIQGLFDFGSMFATIPPEDIFKAREEFTDFAEASNRKAIDEDYFWGTVGSAVGAFAPDVVPIADSNVVREVASGITSKARAVFDKPLRGYIVLASSAKSPGVLTKLQKKIGFKPDRLIYNQRFDIANHKLLTDFKRGKGTGMESNHLLLAEWFKKGPAHLKGLEHYVPATLLSGRTVKGVEIVHQETFHKPFNAHMAQVGLFSKPKYTQAQIEKAIIRAENFYENNPGGELGKAWAAACEDFRINIFGKVKK